MVDVDGGLEVRARRVNCGEVGSRTQLSIRPERVSLNSDAPNNAEAQVRELIYLGDHLRCRMRVGDYEDFIVKVPNAYGHKHLAEGEITPVSWNTEDCRALDAA